MSPEAPSVVLLAVLGMGGWGWALVVLPIASLAVGLQAEQDGCGTLAGVFVFLGLAPFVLAGVVTLAVLGTVVLSNLGVL